MESTVSVFAVIVLTMTATVMITVMMMVTTVIMKVMMMAAIIIRLLWCRLPHLGTQYSASLMQPSTATAHPTPTACTLVPVGPHGLGLIPFPSVPPYGSHLLHAQLYSPSTAADEGWRLQSPCLWRH